MPIQILMPALSTTMTEGALGKWFKKEGDAVKAGDIIAEIETDKATMDLEAADDGTLAKILAPEGTQGIAVDTPIAVLLAAGENDSSMTSFVAAAAWTEATGPATAAQASAALAAKPIATGSNDGRKFVSPLARRIARESGIDILRLTGSGPEGRIILLDVEKAKTAGAAALRPGEAAISRGESAYREVPLSSFREIVAQRLTEASQTIPHFYLTIDCAIDKLLAIRNEMNGRPTEQKTEVRISINDFVIRAAALALRKTPAANASFAETAIREYADVDISVAVATANGLITPIIRCADQKSLAAISAEMKTLVARARDGKLRLHEFQGGSFSISNLGMYGVKHFQAIINPPQGCILAVGVGEPRAVVKDGALAIATQMSCTLSVDHRVIDGALGAKFLRSFKCLMEEPIALL
jgi:pyruvate dehydrogenase E2 component (dihydrolipoamide acetyltransferase)